MPSPSRLNRVLARGLFLALWLGPGSGAFAAPPTEDAESDPSEELQLPPTLSELKAQLDELERKVNEAQVHAVRRGIEVSFEGYADLGFYAPLGNAGVGVVQDLGNRAFPQYAGKYGWLFYGDLLATSINSRGDVPNLGDLPGVSRFDPIHSGAPSFIVNEVNLRTRVGLMPKLLLTTSINFVPRSGSNFSFGDFFDLDIAQLEWLPFDNGKTSFFAGKMDSVLGIEYRERKADARFGVVPTLLARYTTGTPLGLKVRSKLLDDHLIVAVALTNGTSTTEQFFFYNETDTNVAKTVSGRVAIRFDLLGDLELGVSGEYGAQDRALDSLGALWFVGGDLQFHFRDFSLKGQYLRGMSPGRALDQVYALRLNKGAYLEADFRFVPAFGLLLRGELRDAFLSLGTERAYLTKNWRAVAGLHWDIIQHVVLKAEYLHNGEYGGVPSFPDDVATASLLVTY